MNESGVSINDLMILGESYSNWDREKFEGFIYRENLEPKKKMRELSKGWRKRVYFYFALSINPDILILDEISEGVDLIAQKEIITDLMKYFNEEKTVIISTHHIEEFENIIDDLVIIDNGKIFYNGTKEIVDISIGWTDGENKERISEGDILLTRTIS